LKYDPTTHYHRRHHWHSHPPTIITGVLVLITITIIIIITITIIIID